MDFLISICVLSVFLLVGKGLRANIKLLQRLFLPSSIIVGFLALALGPYGINLIPEWILTNWRPLPGLLINLVFATLFLGAPTTAIAGADLDAVVDHNGTPQSATVIVIGEGTVTPPDMPP